MIVSQPAPKSISPGSTGHIRMSGQERIRSQQFESAKNDAWFTIEDRLQNLLYLLLETEPAVEAFEPTSDGVVEVAYRSGTVLAMALPTRGSARMEAIRTKALHAGVGLRLILVPERRLTRWPCRDNRRLVADCGHAILGPSERAAVADALLEQGGSATLRDVANLLARSADPVAAVLSLVSKRIVFIDMERPIDGNTVIHLFDPFASAR